MTDLATRSYYEYLTEDEKARQRAVVKARNYHDGKQPVELTDRLKEFLSLHANDDNPFIMNIVRIVTNAVAERMIVSGFDSDEQGAKDNPAGASTVNSPEKPLAKWAWDVWQHNRMDAKQDETHTGAIRDGEFFVVVDWDIEAGMPRFTPHPRYTDPGCDEYHGDYIGDGFGVRAFYPDDDESRPMLYATKRWTQITIEVAPGQQERRHFDQRLNTYYPDRIERYILKGGKWQPYSDGEAKAVESWVDETGRPLGIPVIHFKNADLRCEAWDAMPLQDALNKALIDLIASADINAFRIFVALGWIPTSDGLEPTEDGSNALNLQPGMILGTTRKAGEAAFEAIEGSDLASLIGMVESLVLWAAMVTDTPLSRFLATKQIAAEGTLKQQEGPLLGKIRKRHTLFGNAWEDCLYLARRLANFFGSAGLNEDAKLSTRWEPAETRDDKAEKEGLVLEQTLGVPRKKLWAKLGYSQQEIEEMESMAQEQEQQEIAKAVAMRPPQPAFNSQR